MKRRSIVALIGSLALLALLAWGALSLDLGALWNKAIIWVFKTQGQLHRGLTHAIQEVDAYGLTAAGSLIGLSFLYGIFHAAGPGHGKVVMSAYMGSNRIHLRRGLVLSTLAALMQGVVAILIVEFTVAILGYSLRQSSHVGSQLEFASFVLVAVLGVILMLRGGIALYKRHRQHQHPHSHAHDPGHDHDHCSHCEHLHQLASGATSTSWRTDLVTVLAIGMRPCTGAILILIAANTLGLRMAGIAAVLAMSVGTAITVGGLTAGVVSLRHSVLDRLRFKHAGVTMELATIVGGGVILMMGLGLIQQGMHAPAHPLV